MAAILNRRCADLGDEAACRRMLAEDYPAGAVEQHFAEAIAKARRWHEVKPADAGELASNALLIAAVTILACACVASPAWAADGARTFSPWEITGLIIIAVIAVGLPIIAWLDPLGRDLPDDTDPPTFIG